MFSVVIVGPKQVLFEGEAARVFLRGDEGEFELLEHHAPLVSVLGRGRIVIDGTKAIPIKRGVARFNRNALVVLAES